MTEQERRTEAIHKFYKAYRELQKYENLRLHTHESIYDDALIEIYRYYGDKKGDRVLKVTQQNTTAAYEQATEQVENMLKQIKQQKGANYESR